MKINPTILTVLAVLLLAGCGAPSGKSKQEGPSREDEVKLQQYLVQGKKLYQTYCIACHQDDGQGLAQLYPPLAGADYLLENIPRAVCIVKNGKTGEILVNGKTYNQMMPPNPGLTPLEIAEITTFVTNSWSNGVGLVSVKDVEKWLAACGKNE